RVVELDPCRLELAHRLPGERGGDRLAEPRGKRRAAGGHEEGGQEDQARPTVHSESPPGSGLLHRAPVSTLRGPPMASSAGPLDPATQQLAASLARVGSPVDLKTASWADIEKGVIKLLMGPFQPEVPEHQLVALGLAGIFADRLISGDQAFWFPHREAPEGGMIGFPDAVLMLSPFQAVVEALARGKLERLDEVTADLRRTLAQARFAPPGGPPGRLRPQGHPRPFHPGFPHFP